MQKSSLDSQRLKYKLGIMYAVMTIIPVLFLLYIILQTIFPSLRLAETSNSLITSLIVGVVAILLMSFAGVLLMYRSLSSLENITRKTETFLTETHHPSITLVTNDEVEKMSHYFTNILVELQNKMTQANQFAKELAEANRKLAQLALKDGLTNLYNQTYIKERLQQEFARAQRFRHSLGIIMLDIDNFKSFNDNYGHLKGDIALKTVSRLIISNLRPTDIPSRYGGEEFLIILPETDKSTIKEIAERIRASVANYSFESASPDKNERLTISVGIANYANSASNVDILIDQADMALYQSKRNGKNQIIIHAA